MANPVGIIKAVRAALMETPAVVKAVNGEIRPLSAKTMASNLDRVHEDNIFDYIAHKRPDLAHIEDGDAFPKGVYDDAWSAMYDRSARGERYQAPNTVVPSKLSKDAERLKNINSSAYMWHTYPDVMRSNVDSEAYKTQGLLREEADQQTAAQTSIGTRWAPGK